MNNNEAKTSGTTAVVILIINDLIYSANVGDSRAIMGLKNNSKII